MSAQKSDKLSNQTVALNVAPKKKKSAYLKGDDDETDEDVHHEEGDHNDVDDVKNRHDGPIVYGRAAILGARINGNVQQAKEIRKFEN